MSADSSQPPPPPPPPSPPSSNSTTSTSTPAPTMTTTLSLPSPYPFAGAPDIIRAHQKDAYFQGLLAQQLGDLHRRLRGARSAHAWAAESRCLADLLYLCLTTLVGNRTLGEEYCGLVQVESDDRKPSSTSSVTTRLPALSRRAAYIAGSIVTPYVLSKGLPALRSRIRARLQRNLAALQHKHQKRHGQSSSSSSAEDVQGSWSYRIQSYLLAHLPALTSPEPVYALSLALFYFSGSYYELAKRAAGLRYVFATGRKQQQLGGDLSAAASEGAGYEVLGFLLVVQMAVQGYLHARETLASFSPSPYSSSDRPRATPAPIDVSLDSNAYSANNALLASSSSPPTSQPGTRINLALATHTAGAAAAAAAADLGDERSMRWIRGAAQRKCTLCLEELKDPAATPCGHVFCWPCIGDWAREKPECPLCRREALAQHILPLRSPTAAAA